MGRLANLLRVPRAALCALLVVVAGASIGDGSARAAPTRPVAAHHLPAYGTVWAANPSNNSITEYAPGAHGNTRPVARIIGPHTGLDEPAGLAVGPNGVLWVTNYDGKSVESFAPGAHGDAKPITRIAGKKTGIGRPFGIVLAPDGSLWVTDEGAADVTEFATGADGNVAPIATISGPTSQIAIPYAMALTPDGRHVWVVNFDEDTLTGSLLEFPATADGDPAPESSITGPNTHLGDPESGIVVDPAGRIHVSGVRRVLTFAPGASGNATAAILSGPATRLKTPEELALDAAGNLWTSDIGSRTIRRFAGTATGNAKPTRTIGGKRTKLVNDWGIAVFAFAPSAPTALHAVTRGQHVRLTWRAPRRTGGKVLTYQVLRKEASAHAWSVITVTKVKSYTDRLPHSHHSRYRVVALNGIGSSPAATASVSPKK